MTSALARAPLLALGALSLVTALAGGLVRLGWPAPAWLAPGAAYHGPLMIGAFLGTVIGVERAVALGGRWPLLGPLATGLGGLALLLGAPPPLGPLLMALGAACLCVVLTIIVRRHRALHTVTMAFGGLAWLVGTALWVASWPVYRVVPWWAGFLVLTIAGERLELARLRRLTVGAGRGFVAVVLLLAVALALTAVAPAAGAPVLGVAWLAVAAWLGRFDIARWTVRQSGLPRFIAVALLAGYLWLAIAGLLTLAIGDVAAGPAYDAILHAIFLGFVFSMIFGHAPIILPAVLGIGVTYRPVFYAHLAVLHGSLILRTTADVAGWSAGRQWGGLLNLLAVVLFFVNTAAAARHARRQRCGDGGRVPS